MLNVKIEIYPCLLAIIFLHRPLLNSLVIFVSFVYVCVFLSQKSYFWKFLMTEISVSDY